MNDPTWGLHRLEVLRYEVLERQHANSPGYRGLRLALPAHATGHQLQTLILAMVDWQGQPYTVFRIHAETAPAERQKIAPGRIYIRSHDESEGTFYSFGGALRVEQLAGEVVVTIYSDAPLLELAPRQTAMANLLADEAEALLSQIEATQGWPHDQLLERLTVAGPLAVYLAIVQSLLVRYEESDTLRHLHPELVSMLQREKQWYTQTAQWADHQPDLALLAAAQS